MTGTVVAPSLLARMVWAVAAACAADCVTPVGAVEPGGTKPPEHALTFAARVWGLAKYHHPAVTACALDWDQVLLDRFAQLEAAPDDASRAAALGAMRDAAGTANRLAPTAETPSWIAEGEMPAELRERLAWLAAQRPASQCYVAPTAGTTRQAFFGSDNGHATETPDRAHRALAAFRYWNAIEYWFPYKDDIGRDWASALDANLQRVLDGQSLLDYAMAMRALTASIEDSHASMYVPAGITGNNFVGVPALVVRRVEGRDVVTTALPGAAPVRPGDELLAVDNQPMDLRKQSLKPREYGSNPAYKVAQTLRYVLLGAQSPGTFRFRRPDGSEYTASLRRTFDYAMSPLFAEPVWQKRTLAGGCTMGIVDMARLQAADVPRALAELFDTQAIVFDVRNYPNGTLWPIVDRLYPQPRQVAHFTRPDFTRPGVFAPADVRIGGAAPNGYAGRVLVLQDERSISQSEYTVMGLQATGRAIVFGSQTAAADGNITSIDLPGGIGAVFTGLGVFYPDGRNTQRIGIVPDVHVTPTIAGLAAGRDEVLDAALDCRWLAETPRERLPRSGLYYAPARAGEGLDIHRDATSAAVLSYGFDASGEPEWLLSAGALAARGWGTSFRRYANDGDDSSAAPGHSVDFHRGPYAPACASAEQHALHPRAQWRWRSDGADFDNCQLPLLASDASTATGLWAGNGDELGWGLSVHHAQGTLTVFVYAYDAAGAPRWVAAQGAWNGNGEVTLPLRRARGFCRTCVPTALAWSDAGTITLDLGDDGRGAAVTIDAALGTG
ncbi:MAG TPA: S41 family peptidase, partial [Xanthomonadales bacterium]|nr:S41 family peptidase [Xanthomonadales bacterium]